LGTRKNSPTGALFRLAAGTVSESYTLNDQAKREMSREMAQFKYRLIIFDFDGTLADSFPWL
jgi:hypothetical protein